MGMLFPIVAALTVLSGVALYWRASNGLDGAWIKSAPGIAFTVGGLAAIISFVGGLVLVGPSFAEQAAVQAELACGDGVLSESQRQRLATRGPQDAARDPLRPVPHPPSRADDGRGALPVIRWRAR
jgi:hypothetical protein